MKWILIVLSMEMQLVLELFIKLNSLNNKQNPSSAKIKKTSLRNLICLHGIYKDRNKSLKQNLPFRYVPLYKYITIVLTVFLKL